MAEAPGMSEGIGQKDRVVGSAWEGCPDIQLQWKVLPLLHVGGERAGGGQANTEHQKKIRGGGNMI